ncbi:glycerophosphodiester phosphodiesterase 1-like [Apostichopus japonicus]|uniref:glycerophosphodiester phosphodiesterase 1-like n=1 Tax=Stichopus japonicus TaxID=307972 RepID=UPI003AB508FF
MADMNSPYSKHIWNLLINVGFKLFSSIFVVLVTILSTSGLLGVSSCLTVSILVWCIFCAVVYWGKIDRLPSHRIEKFLENEENGPAIIGHRGGANEAPENTIAALLEAKKNGAYAVEVDIGVTKDEVAILLHDWTVDRTTDGEGKISEMTLEEAERLNAAANFSNRSQFPSEKIPTLEECVIKCLELDLKIYFDVKDFSDKTVSILIDIYERYPRLMETAIVCSFIPSVIYKVRLRNPEILTALTTSPRFFQTEVKKMKIPLKEWISPVSYVMDSIMVWSMFNWLWYLCGNSAILLNKDFISRSVLDHWNACGIHVVPWTVNDPGDKVYFTESLKLAIITDCVLSSVDE